MVSRTRAARAAGGQDPVVFEELGERLGSGTVARRAGARGAPRRRTRSGGVAGDDQALPALERKLDRCDTVVVGTGWLLRGRCNPRNHPYRIRFPSSIESAGERCSIASHRPAWGSLALGSSSVRTNSWIDGGNGPSARPGREGSAACKHCWHASNVGNLNRPAAPMPGGVTNRWARHIACQQSGRADPDTSAGNCSRDNGAG